MYSTVVHILRPMMRVITDRHWSGQENLPKEGGFIAVSNHVTNLDPLTFGHYLVDAGIPVWCGGMLETGIGRAANAALAALPGFTLPGDVSASSRFYHRDIVTEPAVLEDGHVRVPTGPGLGVEIDRDALEDFTVLRTEVRR